MALATGAAAVAAAFALVAHGRWPYGDYETFRWIICGAAACAGYLLRSRPLALVACVVVALVFNPIAPPRMRAYQWQRYDVAAAVAMVLVALYAWRLSTSSARSDTPTN